MEAVLENMELCLYVISEICAAIGKPVDWRELSAYLTLVDTAV